MIKLLYLIPDFGNSGPVNQCLSLIKNIKKEDYDIEIYSFGDGVNREEFEKYGQTKVLNRLAPYSSKKTIEKRSFDIIHSHCLISDIYSYISSNDSARITTVHNYPDIDFKYRRGWAKGTISYLIYKYTIRNFHKVACSESVMKYLEKKRYSKLSYIRNGVDVDYSRCYKDDKDKKVSFYYLGGMHIRKNIDFLVRNFYEWSRSKNVSLYLIGDGEERESLEEKFKDDKLKFLGHINNPSSIISDLDCYVSCSNSEGLPLAMLECLSMSKLFICSDIEPHKEIYQLSTSKSGFLYKKNNDIDFISKLEEVYNMNDETRNEYSRSSFSLFSNNFSAIKMAESYDNYYKELYKRSNDSYE